jgi:hypothetical protein
MEGLDLKVFLMYLGINIALIFYHAIMYFVGAMGLGGRTGTESAGELTYNILLFALFGAAPNLIIFIIAFFLKKSVKQNAIWATVFSLMIIVGYFSMFSSVFS